MSDNRKFLIVCFECKVGGINIQPQSRDILLTSLVVGKDLKAFIVI